MWRRIKASWMAILLVTLLGVGYLWMYRFEPLLSGETGSDVFVWDRRTHRVYALTDNGEATEWRCDNTTETDGSGSNADSGVPICKRMHDAVQRINL